MEAVLGRGGMATVYRARDTALNRPVAVKAMNAELGRDPSFRRRFEREAQTVAGLGHPHVVAVHDIGEHTDPGSDALVPYLVMEFVDGESLRERQRRGPLGVEEALRITGEVLAGLAASHAKGVVHRDVKPANVMLSRDGACKVMDFGIARAVEETGTHLTRTGLVLGTVPYMAPEQAMGGAVSARTDVYTVGVMLFELLSGRLPFDDDSVPTLLYKHVHEPPPTLLAAGVVHLPPPLLAAFQSVLDRALAKSPDDRYADAAAMRAALEAAQAAGSARTPTVRAERVVARAAPRPPVQAPVRSRADSRRTAPAQRSRVAGAGGLRGWFSEVSGWRALFIAMFAVCLFTSPALGLIAAAVALVAFAAVRLVGRRRH